MNILVTKENFEQALAEIRASTILALDTETTGLYPYQGDRLFALQISTGINNYYFNYNDGGNLERSTIQTVVGSIQPESFVFIHNAKFDLHMLVQDMPKNWSPAFITHDTLVVARLIYNQHMSYSLANCAERAGMEKLGSIIEDHISSHDLYEKVQLPGGKEERKPLYSRVPLELMFEYGCKDVEITHKLGCMQLSQLEEGFLQRDPSFLNPLELEYQMTKVLFEMERYGIKVDTEYSEKAYNHGTLRLKEIEAKFKEKFGTEFVDSAQSMAPLFEARGIKLGVTKDGNPSINNYLLEDHLDDELCANILEHREELKRTNTYFGNFLRFSDQGGVIHANFKQAGTVTGRLSASDPNLQNISKEDTTAMPIRKAFIPREGFSFFEMDYAAQEFRVAVDYAAEQQLASTISKGHDPHQATADMTGLQRKAAKTLNFALLYQCGAAKLSKMLSVDIDAAKLMKARYFKNLPGIKSFLYRSSDVAKNRGYVFNWNGRKYYYPDPKFSYRAPNAIIQGGSSEIIKVAMCRISDFLKDKKSKMLLQVHDSLLFEVHNSERHLVPELQRLMREAYPFKIMPMDTTVEYSESTWYDLKKYGSPEGSAVQIKGDGSTSGAA